MRRNGARPVWSGGKDRGVKTRVLPITIKWDILGIWAVFGRKGDNPRPKNCCGPAWAETRPDMRGFTAIICYEGEEKWKHRRKLPNVCQTKLRR